jgi:tetratricopeptide (TPR) repeat protein
MALINSDLHHELENLDFAMPSHDKWYHKFFKIALLFISSIILVFIIKQILLTQEKNKPQELFAQYYQPYQLNYQLRAAEPTTIDQSNAYQQYDKKNFNQAIELFNKVMIADNTLLFYKGIANIECGKLNDAVKVFEESLKNTSNIYCSQTHWYLSLALLKLSQPEKAKLHLRWLINDKKTDEIYRKNAADVLKKIK